MTTTSLPIPPITDQLRRAATAWRTRRDHGTRTARVIEIRCAACRTWLKPRHFARNTVICRNCTRTG